MLFILDVGILLSELSDASGPSMLGRLWPFVLGVFLILVAMALVFALRGMNRKDEEREEEDEDQP